MKIGKSGLSINHLLYANDLIIFFKADLDSCSKINNVLKDFAMFSGIQVNPQKSEVRFSPNTPERFKKIMKKTLGGYSVV